MRLRKTWQTVRQRRHGNTATEFNGNDFALDNLYFGVTTQAPSYLRGITTLKSTDDIPNPRR